MLGKHFKMKDKLKETAVDMTWWPVDTSSPEEALSHIEENGGEKLPLVMHTLNKILALL